MENGKLILSMLVRNESGVLTRISGLFARRGFNIDSLSVGETQDARVSRVTIRAAGDAYVQNQLVCQLEKLHDVLVVEAMDLPRVVARELLLIKVRAEPATRGQALDQQVETFERTPLETGAVLKSGDLVEIELEIASKNDYEYVLLEDMKAGGFEPVEVRSGYTANDLGAYVEFRDDRVCFFTRVLGRGNHSVAYRLRAEIPGRFSALPARASAMYAPELRANSTEMKVDVRD